MPVGHEPLAAIETPRLGPLLQVGAGLPVRRRQRREPPAHPAP